MYGMDRYVNGKSTLTFDPMIIPVCLYCDKKFPHTGQIRPHLRLHSGFRPYKCSQCDYRHWYKTQITNNHYLNMHGRKGDTTDVVTDFEEEKRLEDHVEEDAIKIRENQTKERNGIPLSPKKSAAREAGAVYHEYKYNEFKYNCGAFEKEDNNNNKTRNYGANDRNNNQGYAQKQNSGMKESFPTQKPNRIQYQRVYEQNDIPSDLKELSIDALLNNEF